MNRNEHSINDKLHCRHCGAELAEDSVFCEQCGKRAKSQLGLWITAAALFLIGGCAWLYFSNRPKPAVVVIKVSTYPGGKVGIVSGGGEYKLMDTVTIKAMVNRHGYMFTHWQDGNTDSIRTIVADSDREFVANFKEKPQPRPVPKFEITVESSNPEWGTVSGGNNTYDSLTMVTLEAIANDGYQFVSWTDGNKSRIRKVKVLCNQEYTARFQKRENKPVETYNLEWGIYAGSMKGGKPDGRPGKVTVTRIYDIVDVSGNTITVYPGETITATKFDNGHLKSGEIHRKDGSHLLFMAD